VLALFWGAGYKIIRSVLLVLTVQRVTALVKNLLGYLLFFLFLGLYSAIVISIGTDWLPDHPVVHLLYYPFVGLIWIYPVIKVMFWIKRRRERQES